MNDAKLAIQGPTCRKLVENYNFVILTARSTSFLQVFYHSMAALPRRRAHG
jgi:hypothetical protein